MIKDGFAPSMYTLSTLYLLINEYKVDSVVLLLILILVGTVIRIYACLFIKFAFLQLTSDVV
jgi:hypothetical protein